MEKGIRQNDVHRVPVNGEMQNNRKDCETEVDPVLNLGRIESLGYEER